MMVHPLTITRTIAPLLHLLLITQNPHHANAQSTAAAFGIPNTTPPTTQDPPLPASGQGVEIESSSSSERRFILNKNPATNALIQRVEITSPSELESKISAVREKQIEWNATPLPERVDRIRTALEIAFGDESAREELAQLISTEMGKILPDSREEVFLSSEWMKDRPLGLMHKANEPETVEPEETSAAIIVRDPLGVIAIIAPWNYPVFEIVSHLLPALVAGNGVLVKPSEMTPLSGAFLLHRLTDADPTLPLEIAQGDGEVGRILVDHPHIDAIAMTGSSATGKLIMKNSSERLKRLILELGGKDPMVVFHDADLPRAAEDAVRCSTVNVGQVCCSVERIYVDERVKKEFEALCVEECKRVRAGDPLSSSVLDGGEEPAVTMGPMVSRLQVDRVRAQVDDAVRNGANVLYTGDIVAERSSERGNYYPATVLTDLHEGMEISQKETFGPIVSIYGFDGSENEAVRLANDSPWGLSASVYSTDLHKGARVASGIRAGQVAVNAWAMETAPLDCPWVGHKVSGHGYHSGFDGYRQYSVPKSIIMEALPMKDDSACVDETTCKASIEAIIIGVTS